MSKGSDISIQNKTSTTFFHKYLCTLKKGAVFESEAILSEALLNVMCMKILIASPDNMFTALLRRSMPTREHTILSCDNEQDFCKLYRSGEFGVVVTSFAHPFINGANIIRECKHKPSTLLISWQQNQQTVLSLYESGIDQYMTLPISIPRLKAKIERLAKMK